MKTTTTTTTVSVEEKITQLFIAGLKKGIVAWQKPWVTINVGNVAYGTFYTGGNSFWANLHATIFGVTPHYCTVAGAAAKLGYKYQGKKWVDKNGNPVVVPIKTGAKGLHLIRVCSLTKESKDAAGNLVFDGDGNKKTYTFPVIKGFCVFSVDDLNWDMKKFIPQTNQNNRLDNGESILAGHNTSPEVLHGGNRAAYSPTTDKIFMPKMEQFASSEAYYRTLFHELVHSTGHTERLNRQGVANFDKFGSHQYSFEELVAEIGAGMLCELSGVPMDVENSTGYINGWIQVLEREPKWIVKAAKEATKAVEYILGAKINALTETEAELEEE